ncbi:SH3 domain-containing protein [Pararhodobacter aggregans]
MKAKMLTLATVSVAALAASSMGAAAATAAASADLNLRAGPGPEFRILSVIQNGESVTVDGCLATQEWCEVQTASGTGWAYAPYLMFDEDGAMKPLPQVTSQTVTVIEDTSPRDEATLIAGGIGAVAGALIAGPIGAIAGGMATGIAANASVDPEVEVYVRNNPVQPVFLSGEPVVGAQVPADVTIYEVPDNQNVAYLNINGDTVLVDRSDMRVIGVVR